MNFIAWLYEHFFSWFCACINTTLLRLFEGKYTLSPVCIDELSKLCRVLIIISNFWNAVTSYKIAWRGTYECGDTQFQTSENHFWVIAKLSSLRQWEYTRGCTLKKKSFIYISSLFYQIDYEIIVLSIASVW